MDTKPDRTLMWTIIGVFVAVATGIIAFLAWVHPFAPSTVSPSVTASSSVQKTLSTYCNALLKKDYQTAYDQGSSGVKRLFSESEWAAMISTQVAQHGGVADCTVSNTSDDGSSGQGTLTFLWTDKSVREVRYNLTNENGDWKLVTENCITGCDQAVTLEIIHTLE